MLQNCSTNYGMRIKNLISLEKNPMSKVVYRGVEYDTEIRRQQQQTQQPQQYNETYRGVKFVKEVKE
jgi:hypothetical protein